MIRFFHTVKAEFAVVLFGVALLQTLAWLCMMFYVQFFNQRLGNSTLYVTQISHFALVLGGCTMTVSSWALVQGMLNARRLKHLQEEGK